MRWDVAVAFALGVVVGAIALFVWWARQLAKPAVVQKVLRDVYAKAHPHWLQVAKDDPARVCPTCGWSERRGAAARAELAAEQAPQKEIRPG